MKYLVILLLLIPITLVGQMTEQDLLLSVNDREAFEAKILDENPLENFWFYWQSAWYHIQKRSPIKASEFILKATEVAESEREINLVNGIRAYNYAYVRDDITTALSLFQKGEGPDNRMLFFSAMIGYVSGYTSPTNLSTPRAFAIIDSLALIVENSYTGEEEQFIEVYSLQLLALYKGFYAKPFDKFPKVTNEGFNLSYDFSVVLTDRAMKKWKSTIIGAKDVYERSIDLQHYPIGRAAVTYIIEGYKNLLETEKDVYKKLHYYEETIKYDKIRMDQASVKSSLAAMNRLAESEAKYNLESAQSDYQETLLKGTIGSSSLIVSGLAFFLIRLSKRRKALRESLDKIAQQNNDIMVIASSVNHDLMNPVINILSGVEEIDYLLEQKEKSGEFDFEYFDEIYDKMVKPSAIQQMSKMDAIKNNLLLIRDDKAIPITQIDLTDNIKDYIEREDYPCEIEIGDLGVITTNQSIFNSLVDNTIKNAYTHNKSKDKKIRIYREGDTICFEDNGVGFPHARFAELSKLGSRGDSGTKGTGIGLSYIVRIARVLNLEVETVNAETFTQGTIFKYKITT